MGLPTILLPDNLRSTAGLMELSSNLYYEAKIIDAEQAKLASRGVDDVTGETVEFTLAEIGDKKLSEVLLMVDERVEP